MDETDFKGLEIFYNKGHYSHSRSVDGSGDTGLEGSAGAVWTVRILSL